MMHLFGSAYEALFGQQEKGMNFYPEYNWLLSNFFMFVVPALYLLGSTGLFFVVELLDISAPPKLLKPCIQLYNLVQIGLCTYMAIGLSHYLDFPNIFAIHREENATVEWFVLVHHLSKYLDLFDTLFIILNRKSYIQLSVLHLWHHATIGPIWLWLLRNGVGGGVVYWGALVNSWTHCLLYSHYMITAFGVKNPWKKYLTRWQIFQFYTCFIQAVVAIAMKDYRKHFALMQLFYQSTMLYLFSAHMQWFPPFVNKYAKRPVANRSAKTA